MFGNWATVFLISKYDNIYIFTLLFSLLTTSQSTVPTIDEVLVHMTDINPVQRLDAKEAKDKLGRIVHSMAPESLLIKPDNDRHGVP